MSVKPAAPQVIADTVLGIKTRVRTAEESSKYFFIVRYWLLYTRKKRFCHGACAQSARVSVRARAYIWPNLKTAQARLQPCRLSERCKAPPCGNTKENIRRKPRLACMYPICLFYKPYLGYARYHFALTIRKVSPCGLGYLGYEVEAGSGGVGSGADSEAGPPPSSLPSTPPCAGGVCSGACS